MDISVDVIIPTYKPDELFVKLVEKLDHQTVKINRIIVINTEEQYFDSFLYGTRFLSKYRNLFIRHISYHEFDHGKTRNLGASKSDAEYMVFMTQDAVPQEEDLIEKLIRPFEKGDIAVTYARQEVRDDCNVIEAVTRKFNYPDQSCVKGKEDLERLGIKTYFCSNVCAAYRSDIFKKLGGFVNRAIFNEDMLYAAKAVEAGYKIAYVSDAVVIHSHNYTSRQQFKRNFDLGVSQADHPEVFEGLSSEKEGKRLVKTAISQLRETGNGRKIPSYIVMSGFKFLGYRFGKNYKKLPFGLIRRWTMSPDYWIRRY